MAQLYNANREWPKCQSTLLGLLKERNRDSSHLAYLVSLLIERGELDQAERWLQEFKPADSSQGLVFLELRARTLKARKRDSDLFAFLQSYAKDHPDQIGAVAPLFERYGFITDAEGAYRASIAQDSKRPTRILPLIGFLARHDRNEEALGLCEQARKTCPAEPLAATLALLSAGKNVTVEQRSRLETWLHEALRRQPDSVPIRLSLASLRNVQERYDQSETLYREAMSRNPNDIQALNNLAWLLAFQTGKEQEALQHIDRAIAIAGENPSLLDTRAVIYLNMGKHEPALQDLRDALAINPDKPVLYVHLARTHQMSNNQGEARKALQRAEKLGFKPASLDALEREVVDKMRKNLAVLQ
jgi:tetratricopeptide (TPR) repeat protein